MAGQIINRGKGVWLVRVYLGTDPDTGKREYHNKTVHGNKKDAETHLTRTLRDRDTGKLTAGAAKLTIGGLLDDLLLDYKVNGKGYDWASTIVEKHLRPAFGHLSISRINSDRVKQYTASRQAAGRANATINHELSLLRHALYLGAKSTPPKVDRVLHIPKLEENNVRKGFFEYEDFVKLRAALPEELRPLVAFGYFTGCRRGEILSLQWSQVDLLERVARLEPGTTKNDQARVIPLGTELYGTLTMQKAIRDQKYPDCPWVFPRQGRRILQFKNAWAAACRKAGLWEGDDKTGKPTKLFHDLRRTGVRNLVRAGVSEKVAMAVSGHKTRSVFDRYNIVDERDLKDAARRLDGYLEQKAAAHNSENPHTIRTQGQNERPN